MTNAEKFAPFAVRASFDILSNGSTHDEERQAFFHGLMAGYAVALKLW